MRKNIMKVALLAAFGLFASYNVYNAQQTGTVSDVALANVEALAWPEDPYDPSEWCTECEACTERYYVCQSEEADFYRDAHRNCSSLTGAEILILHDC